MRGEEHACAGGLDLERYVLGELDGAGRERIDRAVAECSRCAGALAALRADDAAFALRPVPAALRELWSAPLRRRVPWPRVAALVAPIAVAAAAVVLVIAVRGGGPGGALTGDGVPEPGLRGAPGTTRIKGAGAPAGSDLALGFYLLGAAGEPSLGKPGQVLREGDRIQFWIDGGDGSRAVLVGIDGRRGVTRYFPAVGADAALPAGGRLLDSAVLLDDARGPERFFLCTGPDAGVDEVEAAARELAGSGADLRRTERLPLECDQATVWIVKE